MPKKPEKLKGYTAEQIANEKAKMIATAKGDLANAVYDAYKGPNAQLGIAGQPEGPMADKLDKARQRLLDIDKSVAEFGRWAGMARTDIPGYNPKGKK